MTVTLDKFFKKTKGPLATNAKSKLAEDVLSIPLIMREISEYTKVSPVLNKSLSALVRDVAIHGLSASGSAKYFEHASFPIPPERLRINCVLPTSPESIEWLKRFHTVKLEMKSPFVLSETLPNVKELRICGGDITDSSFLEKLPNLRRVEFRKCKFVDFRGIEFCPKLEYLAFQAHVDHKDVRPPLTSLGRLKELDISNSKHLYYLKIFGPMPELDSIVANDCEFEVMEGIATQCPKLRKMDLVDSMAHGFDPLGELTNFEEVIIDREALYRFPDLPLKKLRVSDSLLHQHDLSKYSVMKETLRSLVLGGCHEPVISKLGGIIKSFENLEYLDISRVWCPTGWLKNMPSLKEVKARLSDRDRATLKKRGVKIIEDKDDWSF